MSERRITARQLTREGILAEQKERAAARREAMGRVPQRYRGEVAVPVPGQVQDILAHEATDWEAIEREAQEDCLG